MPQFESYKKKTKAVTAYNLKILKTQNGQKSHFVTFCIMKALPPLKGVLHSKLKLACFVLNRKIINTSF